MLLQMLLQKLNVDSAVPPHAALDVFDCARDYIYIYIIRICVKQLKYPLHYTRNSHHQSLDNPARS